jgi:hypothetical protein
LSGDRRGAYYNGRWAPWPPVRSRRDPRGGGPALERAGADFLVLCTNTMHRTVILVDTGLFACWVPGKGLRIEKWGAPRQERGFLMKNGELQARNGELHARSGGF